MTENCRVTHRDIAARFGCDRSTVSLALRGHPRISESVRQEITRLAEKMGYRPDPSLAMLARHRFATRPSDFRANLAYVVDSKADNYSLQRRHLGPAKDYAEAHGYRVFEFDLIDYPSGEAASKVLYNRGVQGVIIPDMPETSEPFFRDPGWNRFTIVCCSLGWMRVPYHVVTKDVFEGTRLVWREVVRRGYRRIGGAMFRHTPTAEDDFARYGASVAQQDELIPANRRIPLLRSSPDDKEAFLAWFEKHRPEVVISFIRRAYEWLLEAGYKVPEDVAFACCTIQPGELYTGLLVPDLELGRVAVDFLISQMHDNRRGVPKIQHTLLLEPQWVEGATLPWVDAAKQSHAAPVPIHRRRLAS